MSGRSYDLRTLIGSHEAEVFGFCKEHFIDGTLGVYKRSDRMRDVPIIRFGNKFSVAQLPSFGSWFLVPVAHGMAGPVEYTLAWYAGVWKADECKHLLVMKPNAARIRDDADPDRIPKTDYYIGYLESCRLVEELVHHDRYTANNFIIRSSGSTPRTNCLFRCFSSKNRIAIAEQGTANQSLSEYSCAIKEVLLQVERYSMRTEGNLLAAEDALSKTKKHCRTLQTKLDECMALNGAIKTELDRCKQLCVQMQGELRECQKCCTFNLEVCQGGIPTSMLDETRQAVMSLKKVLEEIHGDALVCPISQERFTNPVVAWTLTNGERLALHAYELEHLDEWRKQRPVCPMTQRPFVSTNPPFREVTNLRKLVRGWPEITRAVHAVESGLELLSGFGV